MACPNSNQSTLLRCAPIACGILLFLPLSDFLLLRCLLRRRRGFPLRCISSSAPSPSSPSLLEETNPSKRRGLWNNAMAHPNDPEFINLGICECMLALIWKGLKHRRWLSDDQNIYAAHIIGSYTMNMEEFTERAVHALVILPLVELLSGRLTWVGSSKE